jgi:nickel-dependent lactate racemase
VQKEESKKLKGVTMDEYFLNLNENEKLHFSLPEGWKSVHFSQSGGEEKPIPSIGTLLEKALSQPLNSPPLSELALKAKRWVILVDDIARPTPAAKMLGILLPYLQERGLSLENLTIVVAVGTHTRMTNDQLELKIGKEIFTSCNVIQHDCHGSNLMAAAELSSGKVVRVNPSVVNADLKIALGSILPHSMAGFGGAKMIMPGVSDYDSILEHHLTTMTHPHSALGNIKGNPFCEESRRVARMVGLDFIISCVFNQWGKVVDIVAGERESTFTKGVALSLSKLGQKITNKVDISISCTFPHVHGPQMLKALSSPSLITKEDGAIVLFAPLKGPISSEFFDAFLEVREKSNNNPVAFVKSALSRGEPILPGRAVDFNVSIISTLLKTAEKTIVLVSDKVSKEEASIMGFEFVPSLEEGLDRLCAAYPEADVAIFPSGGLVIPLTDFMNSET